MEIANTIEPVQDGRLHIEKINEPFLRAGDRATPSWRLSDVKELFERMRDFAEGGKS